MYVGYAGSGFCYYVDQETEASLIGNHLTERVERATACFASCDCFDKPAMGHTFTPKLKIRACKALLK